MIENYEILQYLIHALVILLFLPLHEYAHAWTAYKLGDDTASYQGRLTLNPFAHLDLLGTICMLVAGFGWAKPVPINPNKFNRKHSIRFSIAVTALAGPVSNLLVGLVGMILWQVYSILPFTLETDADWNRYQLIAFMLYYFVIVNINLAIFNLIPIPPLDGSKILSYFTSAKWERYLQNNYMVVQIVFLLLLMTSILSKPISWISGWVFDGFAFITSWIPLLFG